MRLYPKKLRGIEDLEKEKKLLLRQSRQLEKEDFLSLDNLTAGKKKSKDKDDSPAASLVDLLPISNPFVKMGLDFLVKRFTASRKERKEAPSQNTAPHKSKLKAIAIEFIGGYLKWKAIELSYKGIKLIIKRSKEREAQEQRYGPLK